jgi:hypothetical protein
VRRGFGQPRNSVEGSIAALWQSVVGSMANRLLINSHEGIELEGTWRHEIARHQGGWPSPPVQWKLAVCFGKSPGILLQLCARTYRRQCTDFADVCHHRNSGRRSRSIIRIPGKDAFRTSGRQKISGSTRDVRYAHHADTGLFTYSFQITYSP